MSTRSDPGERADADADRDIARRATAPAPVRGSDDGVLDSLGRSVSETVTGGLPDAGTPAGATPPRAHGDDAESDDGRPSGTPKSPPALP